MAKTNFSFQKRQKEIARQKKNEEKKLRKMERSAQKPVDEQVAPAGEQAERSGSGESV